MKLRAEVWRGDDRQWYFLTTRRRPRILLRGKRIAWSAWPEDHEEGTEEPFRTHQDALDAALTAVGLATPPEHREAP